MVEFDRRTSIGILRLVAGMTCLLTVNAFAQYGGGTGGGTTGGTGGTTTGGGPATVYNFNQNYHVSFNSPEGWGLKYFAATTLLSGLPQAESPEAHRFGAISIGFEIGWLPQLDAGQRQIGFKGSVPEDLNKAPIFARPVIRIGLPGKFTFVAAAPPPFHVFGVTPHLFAFGFERPLLERDRWTVAWRGYGQVGSVKGSYTCPRSVLGFAPGSPQNPTECVAESADRASLRYAGSEFQVAFRPKRFPKIVPHAAVAGSFIDGAFQVHAQVQDGLDQTRLWTRGGVFTTTGGVTYLVSKQVQFTVDAFYTPLWVQRKDPGPTTNDGLFNVRAFVSYSFH